jgi:hypothetical protein
LIKKMALFFLGFLLFIPAAAFAASAVPISIDTYYLVVSSANDGSTNMMIMASYTNPTSTDYKGDGTSGAVLKVTLPTEATGFRFLDNRIQTQKTDFGFMTTQTIKANGTEVLPYSYKMPQGREMKLTFDYPVQTMQVLVPEGMGSVTFQGIESTAQGIFQFDGQNYVGYDVEGIHAGQTISLSYDKSKQAANTLEQESTNNTTGSSAAGAVTRTAPAFHNPGHIRMWEESPLHSFNPHIFLTVLLVIIIAGISYYLYFRRKGKAEEARLGADQEEEAFQLLISKQKAILEKMIELEETHENGTVTEDEYDKKMGAYKERLIQVKLGLRKFVE